MAPYIYILYISIVYIYKIYFSNGTTMVGTHKMRKHLNRWYERDREVKLIPKSVREHHFIAVLRLKRPFLKYH